MDDLFYGGEGQRLGKEELVENIRLFMSHNPEAFYKIIIGSDSQLFPDHNADFVTAVVVHRVGNGGRYFWRRTNGKKFYTLRDRIIEEVMLSLNTAIDLLQILREKIELKFDFEVHVDIGEHGKSSSLISEVTGMIRAYNFSFKTKPESYAASSVADKHV
ncbi:MAG: hypothetical protein UV58_C0002G0031 [Candidatus Wolfebacteria bacterium GW2011_GWC1_43_10]|uniref:DUF458 domain-containing protein n=1 Tax=Candidatus Wolfebacteria bacterium GW2011_GWC1_43_10 TaxID=1619011 RepID=A0A0G1EJ15_9BACT|nr:MAG: hypothetical protein UV58_C0002G0031 [Candidatus Wolfebacteria bacterium GW2011_GWC1_43_10]KKT23078.1 MAG: hypothetical protein UW08_C0001G0041 [Parcubacteria group bacterium GW2011_GWB1_43_8b]